MNRALSVGRIPPEQVSVARETFAVMTEAFEEEPTTLSDSYIEGLLTRSDFWVITASMDAQIVGGLTAHTLPMTRSESSEVFLYDIAVLERFRRLGAGKLMIACLRRSALDAGITTVFVPVEEQDDEALEFYRSLRGTESPVRFFVWE